MHNLFFRVFLFSVSFFLSVSILSPTLLSSEEGSFVPCMQTATLPNFTLLAKKLTPVTVNIQASRSIKSHKQKSAAPFSGREQSDHFRDFEDKDIYRPLFSDPQKYEQQSLGSGFIISAEGYILTNNHVVEGADEIRVKVHNKTDYNAKVVGSDPATDIALIKINPLQERLTCAALGDSDTLDIGEWVLAIGNPFGLQETITQGIVSAKFRRNLGTGLYENYIQTDASINAGSSGGPLFNLNGAVVGINTLIFSTRGGNAGIGFAIPINLAKHIVSQLMDKGKVVRGWLGVIVQTVTPELAKSFDLAEGRGALIADVDKDGPAARAGFTTGDIIVSFEGREVNDMSDLPLMVADTPVGKSVNVAVVRCGKKQTLPVIIGELKDNELLPGADNEQEDLGIKIQDTNPDPEGSYELSDKTGLLIAEVEPGSPADESGLLRGDSIREINRKPVQTSDDYFNAIREKKDNNILMLIKRDSTSLWVVIKRAQ